jgi:hypothetical protein
VTNGVVVIVVFWGVPLPLLLYPRGGGGGREVTRKVPESVIIIFLLRPYL